MGTFGAQYLACTCPYQRFAPASRLATHSSGPTWFATPLSYDSCIRYTSPLNPAHPPPPAVRAPPPQAPDNLLLVAYASRWRARSAHRLDSSSLERESELFEAAARTAGGGGGKERAARNERSSDWPQGGRAALPLTRTRRRAALPLTRTRRRAAL